MDGRPWHFQSAPFTDRFCLNSRLVRPACHRRVADGAECQRQRLHQFLLRHRLVDAQLVAVVGGPRERHRAVLAPCRNMIMLATMSACLLRDRYRRRMTPGAARAAATVPTSPTRRTLSSSRGKGARARTGYAPSARSARSLNVCLNRKSSSTSFNREAERAVAPPDKFISEARRAARTRLSGSDRWQLRRQRCAYTLSRKY